jgi:predicted AAA+ superfamily ATPase
MMSAFLPRLQEKKLQLFFDQAKVVLLIGARQVGKSTLLRHAFPNIGSIVFDPVYDEYNVRDQPDLFLKSFTAPRIFDEIQFYPELLSALKRFVDRSDATGQYILTGSQNFSMLKNISESMAGRVSILSLSPMTFLEMYSISQPLWVDLHLARAELPGNLEIAHIPDTIHRLMWRGGMPGLIGKKDEFVQHYFASYVQTYIERDVRLSLDIKNLRDFSKFIRLLAMNSSQEINAAHLGREIGIANSTAIIWKEHLKQAFLWQEIEPYFGNSLKRISKKPKGYLTDSGLLCYLNMINTPDILALHPKSGAIFETLIVNTITTYLSTTSSRPHIYHWRSTSQQEVDLVLETDGWLFPIEIKFKAKVDAHDAKGIENFMNSYKHQNVHKGVIIYAGDVCRYLTDKVIAVPWNSLVK